VPLRRCAPRPLHALLLPLLAALLLAGCALPGPRHAAPPDATVTPPPAWRSALTAPDASPVSAAWWQGFGDPVLTALVERALANNLDVLAAAARAEALRIARRRYETGYASRLEYRQAQAEYAGTQQLVPAAELAIARQENALALLTGDSPGAVARGRSTGSPRRRCRAGYPRSCCAAAPTSSRPSRRW
jgi:outer membrane protein TolC